MKVQKAKQRRGVSKRPPVIRDGLREWFRKTPKSVLGELIYDFLAQIIGEQELTAMKDDEVVKFLQKYQQVLAVQGLSSPVRT